jgi:hypothetical protein
MKDDAIPQWALDEAVKQLNVGQSLHYTMPGTRAAILATVQAIRDDECAQVVEWLRKMSNDEGQTFQGRNLAYQIAAARFAAAIQRHEHRSASHDAD